MTLLVTGGAGFIGGNFIREALAAGDEPIVNLDMLTYAGRPDDLAETADDRYSFVRGDIGDRALVSSLLSAHRPRAVVHFAAETHVDRSIRDSDDFIRTNIAGTHSLLEAVRGYWNGLAADDRAAFRFVHISTDEVYGSLAPDDPPFREGDAFFPNSPYSASKAAGDHLVRAWHRTYGLPALTVRCGNTYGPRQYPEKLIPLMILNALAGKPLPLYGDGQQIRDWLYVADGCQAVLRVLERGRIGEVYHVGGACERTNISVVKTICAILDAMRPRADGKAYADHIALVRDRPGHDRRYALDSGKIARELGWTPREGFETGIRKTVKWYLDHAGWVEGIVDAAYRDWIARQYDP